MSWTTTDGGKTWSAPKRSQVNLFRPPDISLPPPATLRSVKIGKTTFAATDDGIECRPAGGRRLSPHRASTRTERHRSRVSLRCVSRLVFEAHAMPWYNGSSSNSRGSIIIKGMTPKEASASPESNAVNPARTQFAAAPMTLPFGRVWNEGGTSGHTVMLLTMLDHI